jgi:hypothetical protein
MWRYSSTLKKEAGGSFEKLTHSSELPRHHIPDKFYCRMYLRNPRKHGPTGMGADKRGEYAPPPEFLEIIQIFRRRKYTTVKSEM